MFGDPETADSGLFKDRYVYAYNFILTTRGPGDVETGRSEMKRTYIHTSYKRT